MTRVIALESNISSFWTQSHFNRILFDETINEMFSRINNSALLRKRLDRDVVTTNNFKFNLHGAISHTTHVAELHCFNFGFNSRFHFKVIFQHFFTFLFFLTCFNDKKGLPTDERVWSYFQLLTK